MNFNQERDETSYEECHSELIKTFIEIEKVRDEKDKLAKELSRVNLKNILNVSPYQIDDWTSSILMAQVRDATRKQLMVNELINRQSQLVLHTKQLTLSIDKFQMVGFKITKAMVPVREKKYPEEIEVMWQDAMGVIGIEGIPTKQLMLSNDKSQKFGFKNTQVIVPVPETKSPEEIEVMWQDAMGVIGIEGNTYQNYELSGLNSKPAPIIVKKRKRSKHQKLEILKKIYYKRY